MKKLSTFINGMNFVLLIAECALSFAQTCDPNAAVNVKSCYEAKGNVQMAGGCSIASGSSALTCTGASFASTDVGKTIYVQGAGTSGASLSSTISAFTSSTTVTLANNAATTVSGKSIFWATDDTTALQNAYNYAVAHGYALYIPSGGGYLHHGLNWTADTIKIYGDAYAGTDLYAVAVTDPGKINGGAQTVGVDISGSGYNQISNIAFWGSLSQWADLAPTVNVLGGRSGATGNAFAIAHIFESDFFNTYGTYNVALYGYEQSDFHNCHFETDSATTSGNLYLSYANTPGFISPYVNLVSPGTSMTKINVSGGRSVFAGTGKMVVLDQGSSQSDYTISLRDAYINMGNNSVFLSDTGPGALRHIVLDTVYAEVGATNVAMVNIAGPAWNWRIDNAQIYNGTGLTVSPYNFASGFLDGEVLIDSVGQASGYSNPEFNASSCAGSVLHLGQEQPTTNCTNYASLNSVVGYAPGITASGSGLYQNIAVPSPVWMKLGTWTGTGPGDELHITMDSTGGENSLNNNQGFAEIVAALSNGQAAPNLTGATAWIWSAKPPITALTLAATGGSTSATNLSWDVWVDAAPYAAGFYRVYVSNGATWKNIDTSGTPPSGAYVVSGSVANTNLSIENSSAGQITCWKTTGTIGYCSSAVSSSGSCTCN